MFQIFRVDTQKKDVGYKTESKNQTKPTNKLIVPDNTMVVMRREGKGRLKTVKGSNIR